MSTDHLWLEYPMFRPRIKQAAEPTTHMLAEPYQATPGGASGWERGYGYRDRGNVASAIQHNPELAGLPQVQAAGREEAAQSRWPQRIGAATGVAATAGLGYLANRMFPGAGAFVAKQLPKSPVSRLAVGAAGSLAVGHAAQPLVNGATTAATDYTYNRNPAPFNAAAAAPVSQALASAHQIHTNPMQQFLQTLQNNPEARNAIVGLLLGGLGGSVLGGVAGRPWLGALLGGLGGGALGGNNPQWGQAGWNRFHDSAWQQAGRWNNRPVEVAAK